MTATATTSTRPTRGTRYSRGLVEDHLGLVETVVSRMANRFPRHIDRTELVSAGMLGLVEAANRYEPDRGVPFAPYAQRRISGAVLDSCRAADWAPRSVRASARLASSTEQGIAGRLGRTPTAGELSVAMGITIDELSHLRELVQRGRVESIDADRIGPVDPPTGSYDVERGDPAAALEMVEQLAYLRDAVSALPARHRSVIVGTYFEERTNQEIAASLDVSQSRVSQLRADALQMLRDGMRAQYEPRRAAAPKGRVARRQARYAASIAAASSHRSRVSTVLAC